MILLNSVQCTKIGSDTMEIKRDAYLEQLKIRKDNGMIKVITEIRRCGK
jgi:predicted AAA+ superfamily ATPase